MSWKNDIDCWFKENTRKSGIVGRGEGTGFDSKLSIRQIERFFSLASEQAKEDPR